MLPSCYCLVWLLLYLCWFSNICFCVFTLITYHMCESPYIFCMSSIFLFCEHYEYHIFQIKKKNLFVQVSAHHILILQSLYLYSQLFIFLFLFHITAVFISAPILLLSHSQGFMIFYFFLSCKIVSIFVFQNRFGDVKIYQFFSFNELKKGPLCRHDIKETLLGRIILAGIFLIA